MPMLNTEENSTSSQGRVFQPGELIIGLKPSAVLRHTDTESAVVLLLPASIKALNKNFSIVSIERVFSEDDAVFLLRFSASNISIESLARVYEDDPSVSFAQPNYIKHI